MKKIFSVFISVLMVLTCMTGGPVFAEDPTPTTTIETGEGQETTSSPDAISSSDPSAEATVSPSTTATPSSTENVPQDSSASPTITVTPSASAEVLSEAVLSIITDINNLPTNEELSAMDTSEQQEVYENITSIMNSIYELNDNDYAYFSTEEGSAYLAKLVALSDYYTGVIMPMIDQTILVTNWGQLKTALETTIPAGSNTDNWIIEVQNSFDFDTADVTAIIPNGYNVLIKGKTGTERITRKNALTMFTSTGTGTVLTFENITLDGGADLSTKITIPAEVGSAPAYGGAQGDVLINFGGTSSTLTLGAGSVVENCQTVRLPNGTNVGSNIAAISITGNNVNKNALTIKSGAEIRKNVAYAGSAGVQATATNVIIEQGGSIHDNTYVSDVKTYWPSVTNTGLAGTAGILIANNSYLICDGNISDNFTSATGGGVVVNDNTSFATFTPTATITGNKSYNQGGGGIDTKGTVVLLGNATVSGNKVAYPDGYFYTVNHESALDTEAWAHSGGGIRVESNGTLIMDNGGIITGNESLGNLGDGVSLLGTNAHMKLSGAALVDSNNEIYIANNIGGKVPIEVTSALTGNSSSNPILLNAQWNTIWKVIVEYNLDNTFNVASDPSGATDAERALALSQMNAGIFACSKANRQANDQRWGVENPHTILGINVGAANNTLNTNQLSWIGPIIDVEKTISKVNGVTYTASTSIVSGDVVTYNIAIKNLDTKNKNYGVSVIDTLLVGTTPGSVTWGALPTGVSAVTDAICLNDGTVAGKTDETCTHATTTKKSGLYISEIAAGATVNVTATYTVTDASVTNVTKNTADIMSGLKNSGAQGLPNFVGLTDANGYKTDQSIVTFQAKTPETVNIPGVIKALTGDPTDETFSFTIAGKLGTEPLPTTTTATVSGAGTASGFTPINYGTVGTYTYYISETPGSTVGMTYDPRVFVWTVTIYDNAGVLSSSATLKVKANAAALDTTATDVSGITFTNNFVKTKKVTSTLDPTNGSTVKVGDTLNYTINYKNTKATTVVVNIVDVIPDNTELQAIPTGAVGYIDTGLTVQTTNAKDVKVLSFSVPGVVSGGTGSVSFSVTVLPSALYSVPVDPITNQGTIYLENDPIITNETKSDVVGKAVTSQSSATGAYEYVDKNITYTIAYKNTETSAANITITDIIPTGTVLTAIPAGATGYSDAGMTTATTTASEVKALKWIKTSVNPNDTGAVSFVVKALQSAVGNEVTNTGSYKIGDNNPLVTNEVKTKILGKKVTSTTDTTDGATTKVGDTLTYTLSYLNDKTSTQTIVVTDIIPENTELTGTIPTDAKGYTSTTSFIAANETTDLTKVKALVWTKTGVTAGASGSVSFTVKVLPSALQTAPINPITNKGTIKIGNDNPTNTNETKTDVIGKSVTSQSSATGAYEYVDKNITYTINYKNTETSAATITITDIIPTGTVLTAIPAGATGYSDAGMTTATTTPSEVKALKWIKTSINPNDTGSVSFVVKALASAFDTTVTNTGSVKIGNNNPLVTNEVKTKIIGKKVTSTTDATNGSITNVGDTLTFTIAYTNDQTTAKTVTISDTIPANTVAVIPTDPDAKCYDSATPADWVPAHETTTASQVKAIVWTKTSVAAGTSGSVSFEVVVLPSALEGATINPITNKANIEIQGGGTFETNETKSDIIGKTVKSQSSTTGAFEYVDKDITYTINYKNTETSAATVTITDIVPEHTVLKQIPAGATGYSDAGMTTATTTASEVKALKWVVDNVPSGNADSVSFTVTVLPEALGTTVPNEGKVQVNNKPVITTNKVQTKIIGKKVTSTTDTTNGATTKVGDTLTFTVEYINDQTTAKTITVTDLIPANTVLTGTIPTDAKGYTSTTSFVAANETTDLTKVKALVWTKTGVAAGASGSVSFTVEVLPSALEGATINPITNKANIEIQGGGTFETNETKTDVIGKAVTSQSSTTGAYEYVDKNITYTINYKNTETSAATVTITDVIPANTELTAIPAGATGYSDAGMTTATTIASEVKALKWVVDNVPSGKADSVKFIVKVLPEALDTTVPNTGSVKIGDNNPLITNEVKTKIIGKKVVSETEATDGSFEVVGKNITYSITYINDKDAASTVTITDVIPANTELTAIPTGATGYSDTGMTTTTTTPSAVKALKWTKTPVDPGDTGTVSFTVKVLSSAYKTTVTNKGGWYTDPNDPKVTNEVKTNIGGKKVTSETDTTNGAYEFVGKKLTYSITYVNDKDVASTVTVTDIIPDNTELTAIPAGATGYTSTTTMDTTTETNDPKEVKALKWVKTSVNSGATGEVTFVVKVLNSAYLQTVDNEAQWGIGNDNPRFTNKVETEIGGKVVESETDPDNGSYEFVGKELTYKIAYKNNTDATADVTVTDIIPDNTELTVIPAGATGYSDTGMTTATTTPSEVKALKWVIQTVPSGTSGEVSFVVKILSSAYKTTIENHGVWKVGPTGPEITTNTTNTYIGGKKVTSESDPANGQVEVIEKNLTYEIAYKNTYDVASDVTITDVIPTNTELVEIPTGAIGYSDTTFTTETTTASAVKSLKWVFEDVAPGTEDSVTFKVKVSKDAYMSFVTNEGGLEIGDHGPKVTNEVKTLITGKKVESESDPTNGSSEDVGKNLTYKIAYGNPEEVDQLNITITDIIPTGTELTAIPTGAVGYNDADPLNWIPANETTVAADVKALKWEFLNVAPQATGEVSFVVKVTSSAMNTTVENEASLKIGDDLPEVKTNKVKTNVPIPRPSNPDKFLVTFVDCYGNTVKIEWVDYKGTSSAPNSNFSDVVNVTAHVVVTQNNCGVITRYKVPNTGSQD